jgi:hypothetical protein
MNPTTVPTEATIIPGGLKTAAPYEYRGPVRKLRNETLRWLDEQEEEHAAWSGSDNKDVS